jgi:hypothetical protein
MAGHFEIIKMQYKKLEREKKRSHLRMRSSAMDCGGM